MTPKDKTEVDPGTDIVEMYAKGEMGPDTCARLLMLQFAKEQGMSEAELQDLEMQMEMEAGK